MQVSQALAGPSHVRRQSSKHYQQTFQQHQHSPQPSAANGTMMAGYPPAANDSEGWYHHMYKENGRLRARNDALTDENTGLLDLVRTYKQRSYAHEAEISKYKRRIARAAEALKKAGLRFELSSDSEGEEHRPTYRRIASDSGDQELPTSSHAGSSPRSGSSDRDVVPQQKAITPKESRRREEERRAHEKAKQEQAAHNSADDSSVRRSNRKRKPIVRDDYQPAQVLSDEEGGQLEAAEVIRCLSNAPTPRGSPVQRGMSGSRPIAEWPLNEVEGAHVSQEDREDPDEEAGEDEGDRRGKGAKPRGRRGGRGRGRGRPAGRPSSRAASRQNSVDEESAARGRGRARAAEADDAADEEEDEEEQRDDDDDEDYVENSRRAREIDAAHNGGNLIGIDLDDPTVWRKKRIPVGAATAACGKKARRTSQYRGVYWEEQRGKWRAQMQDGNTRRHLGYFNTEEEAAECYQNAMREMQRAQVSGKRFNVTELRRSVTSGRASGRNTPEPEDEEEAAASAAVPRSLSEASLGDPDNDSSGRSRSGSPCHRMAPPPAMGLDPELLAAGLLQKLNTPRSSPHPSPRRSGSAAPPVDLPSMSLAASAAASLRRDVA